MATSSVRTFLITDIRGYTAFTVERGDAAAANLASRFEAIVSEVVSAHDGAVVEVRGDEVMVALHANDLDESERLLQEGLDLARRMDNPRQTANFLLALALTETLAGGTPTSADEAAQIMDLRGGYWLDPIRFAGLTLTDEQLGAIPATLRRCLDLAREPA